jgi:hypothetical protein
MVPAESTRTSFSHKLLNPSSFLLPFSRPAYPSEERREEDARETDRGRSARIQSHYGLVFVSDYECICQLLSNLQVAYGARTIGPVSLPPDFRTQAPSFSLLFDHHIPREKETGVKEIEVGMHVGRSRRWALGIDMRRVQGFSISSVTGEPGGWLQSNESSVARSLLAILVPQTIGFCSG